MKPCGIRVGIGYDVHPLVESRTLILGGVQIEYEKGLAGHSDADVLAHAICDALIGAAGEGDIGRWFPDTDPSYRDKSSLLLLGEVCERLGRLGWHIGNIDCTILAEKPQLTPHIPQMISNLAATCKISSSDINVKATHGEGLGFIGRGEGIAAMAIANITRPEQ